MTEKYVAPTNGHEIRVNGSGGMNITYPGMSHVTGHGPTDIAAGRVQSLREFFRDERDQELGRWRWPENPNWVAYRRGEDEVDVLDETAPEDGGFTYHRSSHFLDFPHAAPAAQAYFAAHPVSKPWHDAKQNEIWVLNIKGCGAPEAYRFSHNPGEFRPVNNPQRVWFTETDRDIVDAHRIWPEA